MFFTALAAVTPLDFFFFAFSLFFPLFLFEFFCILTSFVFLIFLTLDIDTFIIAATRSSSFPFFFFFFLYFLLFPASFRFTFPSFFCLLSIAVPNPYLLSFQFGSIQYIKCSFSV